MISLTIPGDPQAWQRSGNSRGHYYTQKKTRDFKHRVANHFQRGAFNLLKGPLVASVFFYLSRPKKLMAKKYSSGPIPCDKRPDFDNLVKGVTDALNELAYDDDAQIFDCRVVKFYHEIGGGPRVEITIREVGA